MGASEAGNGREPPEAKRATSSSKVRMYCWQDLLELEATDQIPTAWRKKFRSDAYGACVARSSMVVLDIFQLKGISLAAAVGLALQVLDPQGVWM